MPWPSTMVISSARLIWLISCATRCATGALEVTHGHEVPAAAWVTEAWLVAAMTGTASSAASAAAASSRPFLYLWQVDVS